MAILPGSALWRGSLEAVLAHPGPLWVYGAPGTGVSTVAAWMAAQRGTECLDDADVLGPAALDAWVTAHGRGVLGAHRSPEDLAVAPAASRCLGFRLQALDEDPASLATCLEALAREDGVPGPLPGALGLLPCPGNLKGLRNRLARWRLLGQFPDPPGGGDLPLETDDLAANLHVLERVLLYRALRRSYGNRVEAAARLGVSRRQLYLLIARHGDPVRGELPRVQGPKRLNKTGRNSRILDPGR